MAIVKFIPKEDREVLKKYLNEQAIFVFDEEAQKKLEELGIKDGEDYNFECNSDLEIDLVLDLNHHIFFQI